MTDFNASPPITDDHAFMLRIDDAIRRSVRNLKDLYEGKVEEWQANASFEQWKLILGRLLDYRRWVLTGNPPPLAERQKRSLSRLFVDGWDPADVDGVWIADTLGYFLSHPRVAFDANWYAAHASQGIDGVLAEAEDLLRRPVPPAKHVVPDMTPEPRMRSMPHHPHLRSLLLSRESAQRFIAENAFARRTPVDRKDSDFLRLHADQHLILAFTDHWLSEPAASTRAHLRQAAAAQREALILGWKPNAWDIFDSLHLAIASGTPDLAEALATGAAAAFTDDRIRPIDFLSWLNLSVLDLQRRDEDRLSVHMHHLHAALFDRVQPSELDEELPMWKASFDVLHALRRGKADDFDLHLARREVERVGHFRRGGSSAPMALFDLHGLAWCALARGRGLAVRIEHVYLPLAVLDPVEGESPPAGPDGGNG